MAIIPPPLNNHGSINESIETQGVPVTNLGLCWALQERVTTNSREQVTILCWGDLNYLGDMSSSQQPRKFPGPLERINMK